MNLHEVVMLVVVVGDVELPREVHSEHRSPAEGVRAVLKEQAVRVGRGRCVKAPPPETHEGQPLTPRGPLGRLRLPGRQLGPQEVTGLLQPWSVGHIVPFG